MHRLARAICACTALLLALPAHGQEAPPEPEGEIVVTGRPLEEQIDDFVGSLTRTRIGDQTIARFEEVICPAVRGLAPSQNAAVTARLRVVAAAAGIRTAPVGCVPNSLLVVTADKEKFIRALATRRPYFFGDLTPLQIRRVARTPGPAAAWQLKGLVGPDGQPILQDAGGMYVNRSTSASSRGRPQGRWVYEGSVLVVERGALDGLNAVQLADYAAMRLYARTEPVRVAGKAPTILNILEAPMGTEIPITLTDWDLAFLRGLYASSPDRLANAQRSQIEREIQRDLEGKSKQD